ncbi:hypothetical protein EWM64_g4626 [Hericium alpestre]|uniref:Uncharacterized protein n=1 Tax=Hericium alpestre TaxID=135208 RepID=A0A4Y9ZYX8_9AGAM|nr:hypothetical protein EWM64_g4626 [Hericium alpestre]
MPEPLLLLPLMHPKYDVLTPAPQQCPYASRELLLRLLSKQMEQPADIYMIQPPQEFIQPCHLAHGRLTRTGSGGKVGVERVGCEETDAARFAVAEELVSELEELGAQVTSKDMRGGVSVRDESPRVRAH